MDRLIEMEETFITTSLSTLQRPIPILAYEPINPNPILAFSSYSIVAKMFKERGMTDEVLVHFHKACMDYRQWCNFQSGDEQSAITSSSSFLQWCQANSDFSHMQYQKAFEIDVEERLIQCELTDEFQPWYYQQHYLVDIPFVLCIAYAFCKTFKIWHQNNSVRLGDPDIEIIYSNTFHGMIEQIENELGELQAKVFKNRVKYFICDELKNGEKEVMDIIQYYNAYFKNGWALYVNTWWTPIINQHKHKSKNSDI